MSVIERARRVMDETRAAGTLLRSEPFPMVGVWEGPARWRLGPKTWEKLRRETHEMSGYTEPLPDDLPARLFGYPIHVDDNTEPNLLILEPAP